MNKAIFFFAGSQGIGLTSHFADISIDLFHKGQQEGWDVYVVSDKKEQNPRLWEKVEQHIPAENIVKYDESHPYEVVHTLEEKISPYKKCVLHLQGLSHIRLTKKLLERDNIKSVVTIHSFSNGNWKRPIVSFIYSRYISRYVEKAIFLSPFASNCFLGSGRLKRQGKVVHIPFNLPLLSGQYEKIDDGILESNRYNVVYLANFFKNKGHEKYFPAIVRFVKENPDVRVYFFGEGVRRQAVIDRIKASKVSDQIFCPGRVPRNMIPSILSKSRTTLLLSKSENANHAAIESLMMGVPHISTRVGASESFIQDYINGIGIDGPADLYKALTLLKSTPELGAQMAENGKRMIETFYLYENMLDAWFRLYKSLS